MDMCGLQASRKNRYAEDFGWNLRNLVAIILEYIRQRHHDHIAKVSSLLPLQTNIISFFSL